EEVLGVEDRPAGTRITQDAPRETDAPLLLERSPCPVPQPCPAWRLAGAENFHPRLGESTDGIECAEDLMGCPGQDGSFESIPVFCSDDDFLVALHKPLNRAAPAAESDCEHARSSVENTLDCRL